MSNQIETAKHSDRPGTQPPLLKIHDATVIKNSTRVLDRISLTIREGEHTAILGANQKQREFMKNATTKSPESPKNMTGNSVHSTKPKLE